MKIRVKRQENAQATPYYQTFLYDGDMNQTVAGALDYLNNNDDLRDIEGKVSPRIRWECSCQQKQCGACAMVIDGVPRLACDVFLREYDCEVLTVEPLSKFRVVADLVVDRSIIWENLKQAELWLKDKARVDEKEHAKQYEVAKCLKCGLCLEVCPNYAYGENFYGAIMANESYLLCSQSESAEEKKKIKAEYKEHFAKGCSKSLACKNICPMKMPTLSSMAKMNKAK